MTSLAEYRKIGGVLVLLLLLCGCSGGAAKFERIGRDAAPEVTATGNSALLQAGMRPNLPAFPAGSQDIAAARRSAVVGQFRQAGSSIFDASPAALIDSVAGTCVLPAGTEDFDFAIYRFAGLTDADTPYVIGIELLEPLPQSYWIGYSDYSTGAWSWFPVSNPQVQEYLAIAVEAQARSSAGNVYVALAVHSAGALSIEQVSLELDAVCPPPQAPTVSQGDYHDRIHLSWDALSIQQPGMAFDAILVERAAAVGGPYTSLAELGAESISYEDIHEGDQPGQNDLGGAAPLFYRLRLQRLGAVSVPSLVVSGYRELTNVQGLTATDGSTTGLGDRVSLSWEAVPGAESYELEYRSNDGGSPAAFTSLISLDQQLSYDHLPGSPPGKGCDSYGAYRYRIRASGLGLTSPAWREVIGSRKLDKPMLAPSQGTDPNGVVLSWGAVPGASGYRIYHSPNADLLADVPDNDPYLHSVSDFDLHDYTMVAYCNSNVSVGSGWTVGYRQGWHRHTAGSGSGVASSMVITDSGRPLLAAREGQEVRLYLADSAAPDSSDDWIEYGWNGPPNINPALAMMNGKPVMFNSYFLGDTSFIWFEQASQALPDSLDDWSGYMFGTLSIDINGALSPLTIGLRPMVAVLADDSLHFYCATADEPDDPAEWVGYALDAGPGVAGNCKPVLFDLGGRPALVYQSGSKVYYGRSAVTAPAQDADWTFHEVFDASSFDAFGVLSGFDAVDAGGYPAFAFSGVTNTELRLARATVQEPTQGSEWTYSYVGLRPVPGVMHEVALAQVGSGLRIIWAPAPELYSAMPIFSFSTPSLAPDAQNAWTKKIVDYGVGPVDLVSNGGAAAAIYSSEDADFLHSVRYAGEL